MLDGKCLGVLSSSKVTVSISFCLIPSVTVIIKGREEFPFSFLLSFKGHENFREKFVRSFTFRDDSSSFFFFLVCVLSFQKYRYGLFSCKYF